MNVLIVDDDRYLTDSMSYFLRKYGYSVDIVNKYSELDFNKIRRRYDVVVLDLMMRRPLDVYNDPRKETGEYIYEKIRDLDPKQKIIIVTAVDSPGLMGRFKDEQVKVFKKPLDAKFSALIEAIKNA